MDTFINYFMCGVSVSYAVFVTAAFAYSIHLGNIAKKGGC